MTRTDQLRLAAIRDVTAAGEAVSAGATQFVLDQLAQRDALLEAVAENSLQRVHLWEPWQEPIQFSQGVGSHAQKVLALIRGTADD